MVDPSNQEVTMGAPRWGTKPAPRRARRRRLERAVLSPVIGLVVILADRRMRAALARTR
jgi:hypothetical protein